MGLRSWLFGDEEGLSQDFIDLYDAMDPHPGDVEYGEDDLDDTPF